MSSCPYCESTRSLLIGQVYCSRHATADMHRMGNGTLYIRSRRLEETADHVSRLSIRLMLNGRQWYKVGGADRTVHPDNFLVIDQGQHYRTAFESEAGAEMLMVGFRPGLAAEVRRNLMTPTEQLMDDPTPTDVPIAFFEQTYPMDPEVRSLFARLHGLVRADPTVRQEVDVDLIHDRLMERLVMLQFGLLERTEQLSAMKRSTRIELWRRLNVARDLAESCPDRPLTVPDLANAACLSEHHFKRSFRAAFGIPPHAFLRQVRMQRAHVLLAQGRHLVTEVAAAVGYFDPSAFGRSYRRHFGRSPSEDLCDRVIGHGNTLPGPSLELARSA